MLQTWCLTERSGEVTAITSQEEVCDFMEYAVAAKRETRWAQKTITAVKTWTQRLAWYHGYISKEDWPEGDHSFLKHIRMHSGQASSGLAVGVRDTVTSSRHALEDHQMQQTYRFALTQLPKRQMLLHNVFASLTLQTTVRPNEMSYMVSLDMSMSKRPHLKLATCTYLSWAGWAEPRSTQLQRSTHGCCGTQRWTSMMLSSGWQPR